MSGEMAHEAENGPTQGPWVPIAGGFLCDPHTWAGESQVRDGVAYWRSATDGREYVLDLTTEAVAEADRRNRTAATRTRPGATTTDRTDR